MSRGRRRRRTAVSAAPVSPPADLGALQRRLGYRFRNVEHLRQALVHRSSLNETGMPAWASNERLEFLGDAVLELAVTRYLYGRYPRALEGQLTQVRAQIVQAPTLAKVAERLGIAPYLQMSRGELLSGRQHSRTILARTFEAIVGAVFVDSAYWRAERWLLRVLRPELEAASPERLALDPKSLLLQQVQSEFSLQPVYRTVLVEGPPHARTFHVEVLVGDRVLGRGEGPTKQAAEQQAAERALLVLPDIVRGAGRPQDERRSR